MMKVLTHNIQQEREDQRDRSAQLFMWCIVVSMHQDDGIGASRLLRACNEMDAFEKKYQTAILYGSSKNATDAMRENLKGICDFEVRLPVDRAPRGRREEQLRMASNQGAEIAWLVMAATCHETFGYGRDRLAHEGPECQPRRPRHHRGRAGLWRGRHLLARQGRHCPHRHARRQGYMALRPARRVSQHHLQQVCPADHRAWLRGSR